MLENIALSFQGIWGHKMRSFLTMLGIIIGIAAIITIVSTIKGTNEQIKANLIGAGNNCVTVQLKQDGNSVDMAYSELPEGVRVIDEETRAELDQLEGVAETTLYRNRSWVDGAYYNGIAFNGQLYGVDSHCFSVFGYSVIYGRGFVEEDFKEAKKNIILDLAAVTNLFEGKTPLVRPSRFSENPLRWLASYLNRRNLPLSSIPCRIIRCMLVPRLGRCIFQRNAGVFFTAMTNRRPWRSVLSRQTI